MRSGSDRVEAQVYPQFTSITENQSPSKSAAAPQPMLRRRFIGSTANHTLTIYYFNVRSLLPKIDNLRILCSLYSPDLVCVVESWLGPDISNSEISIPSYSVFRLDRNRHGGGVLIYVKAVFTCSFLFKGTTNFECIILSVLCNSRSPSPDFTIALFYRPPCSNICVLDRLFSTLCNLDVSVFF